MKGNFFAAAAAATRLAEVDPPRQFPEEQNIGSLDDLATQRRGVDQFGEQTNRPQVGKQAELFTDLQQAGLGSGLRRGVVPLWTTDRTEQHCVAGLTCVDRCLWQWITALVNRNSPHQMRLEGKLVTESLGNAFQDTTSLLDNFGTDAVTGQENNVGFQVNVFLS